MMSDAATPFLPRLVPVACDNCGSDQDEFLFSGPDRLCGLPGVFTLVRCRCCGWIRQNPRPSDEDLEKYYPENYVAFVRAVEEEKGFWNRWDRRYGLIKRCKSIERFIRSGRILEVGCGTGVFLNEMRRRGWSVIGIEPNAYASDYARRHFGLDIFRGTIEQFNLVEESFDVIYLSNVLEHLSTPAQDLRRMQRALKPQGLLVLSIPNLESLDCRLFGESWIGWELPRHLYLFPHTALVSFLSRLGMRIVARDCPAGSYYAFLLSLQLYLYDHAKLRKETVTRLISIARQLPLRLFVAPLFWLLDKWQLTSILTYYIRKEC